MIYLECECIFILVISMYVISKELFTFESWSKQAKMMGWYSPHLITLVDYKDVLQSILFTQIKVPVICDAHCMRIYLLFSIIKVLITQTRIPLCLFLTQAWGSYDN